MAAFPMLVFAQSVYAPYVPTASVGITVNGLDTADLNVNFKTIYSKQNLQFDFTKNEINAAAQTIVQLRTKPIVVRLKTNKKQIAAYRNAGSTKIADKIEAKSLDQNLRIISACIKYFNFAPLYFLDTEDNLTFLETDTLRYSSLLSDINYFVVIPHDSVFFLDYGMLYNRDRVSEWKYKDYGVTDEGSTVISDHAFVVRNSKSEQLMPPVPFYAEVNFSSGKAGKAMAEPIQQYIKIDKLTGNSMLKETLDKPNEFDAAILRLNGRLYNTFAKIVGDNTLNENFEKWYAINPNKPYYPLWIEIEKKLLSINKAKKFTTQY